MPARAQTTEADYDGSNRMISRSGSPLSYDNNRNLTAFNSSTYTWGRAINFRRAVRVPPLSLTTRLTDVLA